MAMCQEEGVSLGSALCRSAFSPPCTYQSIDMTTASTPRDTGGSNAIVACIMELIKYLKLQRLCVMERA